MAGQKEEHIQQRRQLSLVPLGGKKEERIKGGLMQEAPTWWGLGRVKRLFLGFEPMTFRLQGSNLIIAQSSPLKARTYIVGKLD